MSKKTIRVLLGVLLSTSLLGAETTSTTLRLAPDQSVPRLMQAPTGLESVSHELVTYSRAVQPGESLDLTTTTFQNRGREYFLEVTAEELSRGVAVPTHGPSAWIRINPVPGQSNAQAFELEQLEIRSPDGRSFRTADAATSLADYHDLKDVAPFPMGTAAFRLDADLGSGEFRIRQTDLEDQSRWLIHVLDVESPVEFSLRTLSADHFVGDQLEVEAALTGDRIEQMTITGSVTSPNGQSFPLAFRSVSGGKSVSSLEVPAAEAWAPGLWEVHAFSEARVGDLRVLRNLRTAFQVTWPTARLDGTIRSLAHLEGTRDQVLSLGLEVATTGRYEVRGVLYHRVGEHWRPLSIGHTATWLEPGFQRLDLRFEAGTLGGSSGPYQLRGVELRDQSRLSILERRVEVPLVRNHR